MSIRKIFRDHATALDASFGIEAFDGMLTVVIESKGGTRGKAGARNVDYQEGFELLLGRLRVRGAKILDAVVESRETRHLSLDLRRLNVEGRPYPISIDNPAQLRIDFGAAQARVGREPGARGSGNSTKRVRLMLDSDPSLAIELETDLAGKRRDPECWALFATPKRYRIEEAVRSLDEDTWTTKGSDIRRGDRAIIWRGQGPDGNRGVIAFAEILSDPKTSDDSGNHYWNETLEPEFEPRVRLQYITAPKLPLWLNAHKNLGRLSVARARGGTVFTVSADEWDMVTRLAGGVSPSAEGALVKLGRPYRNVGTLPSSAVRIPFEIDPNKIDRGTQAHATTQDSLANFLTERGILPLSSERPAPDYDLAWEHEGTIYVAEVKSITDANEEKQLRLGLGQVLFYRQKLAQLGKPVVAVLVAERAPKDETWAALAAALGLILVWPGGFGPLGDS